MNITQNQKTISIRKLFLISVLLFFSFQHFVAAQPSKKNIDPLLSASTVEPISNQLPTDRGRIVIDTIQIPNPTGEGFVDGFTLKTDQGSLLRGVSIGLEADAKYFEMLHNRGINAVRHIFFDPYWRFKRGDDSYIHFDGTEPERVADYMLRLERVVNLASIYGIYVMINFHAVFAYTECPNSPNCELSDIPEYCNEYWNVVAPYFKNREHVFYELLNEPKYMYDWTGQMIQDQKEMYDNVRALAPDTHIVLASISGVSENKDTNDEMLNLANEIDAKGIDWSNASIGFHPYHTDGTSQSILLAMAKYPVLNTEENVPHSFVSKCIGCDPYGSDEMDGELWGVQTHERLQIGWFHWVMDNEVKIDHNYQALVNDATEKEYLWEFDTPIPGSPDVNIGNDTTLFLSDQNQIMISSTVNDPENDEIVSYKWEQYYSSTGENYLKDSTEKTISLSGLKPGTYSFCLTVVDQSGFMGSDAITITVTYKSQIPGKMEAEYYSNMSGVNNAGFMIGSQDSGDWLDYQTNIKERGKYKIDANISRGSEGTGSGQFSVNGTNVSPIFDVPFTGENWDVWKTITTSAYLQKGEQTLHLNITTGPWNADYYQFTKLNVGALAGADTLLILLGLTEYQLQGDTLGNIKTISWEKIAGPDLVFKDNSTLNPTIKFEKEGKYIFKLTVSDALGNSDAEEVTVVTKYGISVNVEDKKVILPANSIKLVAATKNIGKEIAFKWEQISGKAVAIANDSVRSILISGLDEGQYSFRITVKNELGYSASDEVLVTVVSNQTGFSNADIVHFKVYPNPAGEYLMVEMEKEGIIYECCITNMAGQKIYSTKLMDKINQINFGEKLRKGSYIITLQTGKEIMHQSFMVK